MMLLNQSFDLLYKLLTKLEWLLVWYKSKVSHTNSTETKIIKKNKIIRKVNWLYLNYIQPCSSV